MERKLIHEIQSTLYISESVLPYTVFQKTELNMRREGDTICVSLPPHSVAAVSIRTKQ